MYYKPGERLAIHPAGPTLIAYEIDGQMCCAYYVHGGIVRPAPGGGWQVIDGQGRNVRLAADQINQLNQIAPLSHHPPLVPYQAGIVANEHAHSEPCLFVDWIKFWAKDRGDIEWLREPLVARGRGHAIFASHKVGKSLVMLTVAVELATGPDPIVVIYLDYEMTETDLEERLTDMGHGPGSDFSRLRYAVLPSLAPLDTEQGAGELLEIVDTEQAAFPDHHIVVIIDTTARAVQGEENSADTIRGFYRHTGLALKRRGVSWARLDHAGKDPGKGQRGSSAKGDDVDIVWRVTPTDDGLRFRREAARMSWVPETVDLVRRADPLRFERSKASWPAGTKEKADLLDKLDVPVDVARRKAIEILKDHGEQPGRTDVLQAAINFRKERGSCLPPIAG